MLRKSQSIPVIKPSSLKPETTKAQKASQVPKLNHYQSTSRLLAKKEKSKADKKPFKFYARNSTDTFQEYRSIKAIKGGHRRNNSDNFSTQESTTFRMTQSPEVPKQRATDMSRNTNGKMDYLKIGKKSGPASYKSDMAFGKLKGKHSNQNSETRKLSPVSRTNEGTVSTRLTTQTASEATRRLSSPKNTTLSSNRMSSCFKMSENFGLSCNGSDSRLGSGLRKSQKEQSEKSDMRNKLNHSYVMN